MKTFKQFIREYSFDSPPPKRFGKLNKRGVTQTKVMGGVNVRGLVFRSDDKPLPADAEKRLRTYTGSSMASGQNLTTVSGAYSPTKAPPKGQTKSKGLYALRNPRDTAFYAGIKRNEPRAADTSGVLYRPKGTKDIPTTISAYRRSNFRRLPSGEMFSSHPGKPVGSITIQNPKLFRKSTFRKEKGVQDVEKTANKLARKDKLAGAEGVNIEQFIKEEKDDVWYHGAGSRINKFNDAPLYLTRSTSEASGFARRMHLGGHGLDPHIHSISSRPGKTINIDNAIYDAMDAEDDIGDTIDREIKKAKDSGARYIEHSHPSFSGGDDFVARVSLYPHQDLSIKSVKRIGRQ